MSTYGLNLEILNSMEKSSKRKKPKTTVDIKERGKKDCQKLHAGGMKRRLSAHISDANIVFSRATDGNRSSVHVAGTGSGPSAQGCCA